VGIAHPGFCRFEDGAGRELRHGNAMKMEWRRIGSIAIGSSVLRAAFLGTAPSMKAIEDMPAIFRPAA